MNEAVALLSAGLDSSVALAMALDGGWKIPLALTFDYGQRAAGRETAQAAKIAAHFGVPHRVFPLPWFRELGRGGGLLKAEGHLPEEGFGPESAKAVWVPNRNGVFLEIGAQLAEDLGAKAVLVGFNAEEGATFPDNTVAYLEALTKALSYSTASRVRVLSPTAEWDKKRIVAEASRLKFPLELLWSCYRGEERMCGRCESCRRLQWALEANGVKDHGLF